MAGFGAVTTFPNDTTTPAGGNHTIAVGDNVVYVAVLVSHSLDAFGLTGCSCTYGGTAMSLIRDYPFQGYGQILVYRLASASLANGAVSFAWTGGTANNLLIHSVSCNSVDISGTPERTVFVANADATPSDSSVTITDVTAGDLILSFGCRPTGTTSVSTPPSGATNRAATNSSSYCYGDTYTEEAPATGSQVNAYVGSASRSGQVAFAIKGLPVAVASPAITPYMIF